MCPLNTSNQIRHAYLVFTLVIKGPCILKCEPKVDNPYMFLFSIEHRYLSGMWLGVATRKIYQQHMCLEDIELEKRRP